MKWTNFMLLQLLFTLASVHCLKDRNLYPFSEVLNGGLDNDTHPCDNFYQYTCGKWSERNEIPEIFKNSTVYTMTELSTVIKVKEILDNPNIDENNEELYVEKKFYDACMDEDYSLNEGDKLIAKILDETPQTSWQDVAEYFATEFSAFHLFHIKLTECKHLQIERPRFSESNIRPFKDMINVVTEQVMWLYKEVDNMYAANIPHIHVINESVAFIDFINQIIYDSEEDIQTVTISELQKLHDINCFSEHAKIEWLQFFQRLAVGTGINFTKYDKLKVDVRYLEDLCDVLSEAPEYAIVNYLLYNFVFDVDTNNYLRIDRYEISYIERYIHCIKTLKITKGITKELVKSHLTQENLKIVDEMFNNIKAAMIKEIENSWLVNDVKEAVLIRASGIKLKYGIIDDPFKKKLGREVTYKFPVGRVAFKNELNLKRAQIINILQVYKEAYKLHRTKRSPKCIASYFSDKNEFFLGLPMLFPPYFYENAPIAFNYGRLGFTIGHEISHAFDFDILQLFTGIYSKDDREETESMLVERKKCFVDEFNSFGVDGLRTLDENVADTQGLKLAWKAMKAVIKNKISKDKGRPNFKRWNQEKLFFLSFANQWCQSPEDSEYEDDDVHSPFVIRTLGTLKNMNQFSKTYRCTNEAINPKTKCDWWAKSSTKHFKLFSFRPIANIIHRKKKIS